MSAGPIGAVAKPIGSFFAMVLDTVVATFKPPFQWREFIQQAWFIASVTFGPTILVSIPFTVLVTFQFNNILTEVGAIDLAGAGSAYATVTQIGPIGTTFVVAGASATAICADIGSRKIREELDAMQVLGIDPIHRLVVPRVLATMFVTFFINGLLIAIGITGGFLFSVYLQGANPGQFIDSLTLITGSGELIHSQIKATIFGMLGGFVACYRGLNVAGGAKGVGNAVNETVVYTFVLLFPVNVVLSQLPYALGLLD
ncbi:MlaE family ABC transporter permease [Pseudonocardia spirodelae]|uniref:ABC transporter permease n=1 Tax=Pseudonocardia spirodelae TaxID=3133431 RepID=A0ABU8T655_9PSEU